MTGFTPEQIPVLNGLARGFGVFDHWFCEVPSQTFTNRSFWTAATSSGFVVNSPASKFIAEHAPRRSSTGSTRTARRGRSTSASRSSSPATGLIHFPRLKDRFATHFVPFSPVRDRCRQRRSARLLVHRAVPDPRPQRLPPGRRACPVARHRGPRCRPAVVDSGRRGVPLTDLQRLHGDAVRRPAPTSGTRACSSAGTNRAAPTTTFRRRPGAAAGPSRSGRPTRLHVRPVRLPGPRHRRLTVDGRRRGVQRGAPPHVTHRHPARAMGAG